MITASHGDRIKNVKVKTGVNADKSP